MSFEVVDPVPACRAVMRRKVRAESLSVANQLVRFWSQLMCPLLPAVWDAPEA